MAKTTCNIGEKKLEVKGLMKRREDPAWDRRESVAVTVELTAEKAAELFADDAEWSMERQEETVNKQGQIVTETAVQDWSEYCVAGPITDHRNGTVTVKMGKPTEQELLTALLGE